MVAGITLGSVLYRWDSFSPPLREYIPVDQQQLDTRKKTRSRRLLT